MKKVYQQPTLRFGNINESLLAGSFNSELGAEGQDGGNALSRQGNLDFSNEEE